MDRTVATGTGFIGPVRAGGGQVVRITRRPVRTICCSSCITCRTRTCCIPGKTVIQYIYDSHYEGAEAVAGYVRDWKTLKGRVDDERYRRGARAARVSGRPGGRLARRGIELVSKASGIPDAKGRVGHYPGRIEAEAMTLDGYVVKPVTPWESASGEKAVECRAATCTAGSHTMASRAGEIWWCSISISRTGCRISASGWRASLVAEWAADDHLPTRKVDSSSSSRRVIPGIALRTRR